MTDFTKGKWAVDNSYSTMLLVSAEANTICQIDCDTYNFETSSVEPTDEEMANAHLIAAAPEMYAMLEMVLYVIDFLTDEVSTDDIKDLLSKARGE